MGILGLVLVGVIAFGEVVAGRRRRAGALVLALALIAVAALLPGSFENQKIVGRLLMPLGLLTLILGTVASVSLRARRWGSGGGALALVASLFVFAGPLPGYFVHQLEAEVPPDPGGIFDAVWVLGGGTALAPGGDAELGPAGDRLRRAAELFHTGRARYLIASGRNPIPGRQRDLAAETAQLWEAMGVDPNRVLHLPDPVNTSEEVTAFVALTKERGFGRVGVVSSAWHLPRVMARLENAGLASAVPLASHHLVGPDVPLVGLDFVPNAVALRLSEIWLWERLGRALGR